MAKRVRFSLTSEIKIQDDRLVLIHIPLDLYPLYLQPILRLIFHEVPVMEGEQDDDEEGEDFELPEEDSSDSGHTAFLNLSITPVECSIVCSRKLADMYFAPIIEQIGETSANGERVSISEEDFIAMQIDGEGLDAGQRVLELSSPLAMAGISILFISTYFSDYILVPFHSKGQVISALQGRGFTVEASGDRLTSNGAPDYHCSNPPSPITQYPLESYHAPSTLPELETRTFENLRNRNIHPKVDKSLRLVQCAAHHRYPNRFTSFSILRPGLTTTLVLDNPRFLSFTITPTDPSASILLETRLLPRFFLDTTSSCGSASSTTRAGDDECNLLLGSKSDTLVPIILDLRELPLEASGVVCGVASKLAVATRSRRASEDYGYGSAPPDRDAGKAFPLDVPLHPPPTDPVEISFLSTVRAGTVIVDERELGRAKAALDAESGLLPKIKE
ncbi:hypothetical protein FQN54_009709 [Arachnomyces sp. PD_36]|nr:hypothetical protein FQN54_009709 [Arachnomyces sp. PD_36]